MSFTFSQPKYSSFADANPWDTAFKNALDNYKKSIEAQYARPNAKEDLMKKQLYNQFYGPNMESQMGLRGAQAGEAGAHAGYLGEQSKYYGKNIQSQMQLRAAEMAQAQAAARKNQMIVDYMNGKQPSQDMQGTQGAAQPENQGMQQPGNSPSPQYQPGQGQPPFTAQSQQGNPQGQGQQMANPQAMQQAMAQPQQNAAYGIPVPQPTREDMMNKMAFGMDTYSAKRDQAVAQQNEQRQGYMERTQQSNQASKTASETNQLLDQYNYWMDHGLATGPGLGYIPGTTAGQNIDQIINRMLPEAIESLKAKMGSAKFTNVDTDIATKQKPSRNWTAPTRKFYTDSVKGINDRIFEKTAFDRVTSNPQLGIQTNIADSLWSAYQKHHPIVKSEKNKELNKWAANGWQKYLTPEAIKSIQETGDYDPKDKPLPSLSAINKTLEKKYKERKDKSMKLTLTSYNKE